MAKGDFIPDEYNGNDHVLIEKISKNIRYLSIAKMVGMVLTIVATAITLGLLFFMLTTLQDAQDAQLELSQQIDDCINPDGDCYKNGDRRNGATVKAISENQKRIVTVAAYCSKQPGNTTIALIEACVNKELK